MTPEEKDRFICDELDVCWHERVPGSFPPVCCCGVTTYYLHDFDLHLMVNPDFTSEAGRVQLLKLIQDKTVFWKSRHLNIALYMLDDTGRFRDAVYKWLGGTG